MSDAFHKSDIVILVTGLTGVGKSTFINNLLSNLPNQRMPVGDTMSTCTKEVEYAIIHQPEKDRRLVVMDTPGFDQDGKPDSEVLQQISTWLQTHFPQGIARGGVIYLHDISRDRNSGMTNVLLILRHSFGRIQQVLCPRIALATTKWDKVDPAVGNAHEEELKSRHWRQLISAGSQVFQFRDNSGSILHHFLPTLESEIKLDIDNELADLRKAGYGQKGSKENLNAIQAGLFQWARLVDIFSRRSDQRGGSRRDE